MKKRIPPWHQNSTSTPAPKPISKIEADYWALKAAPKWRGTSRRTAKKPRVVAKVCHIHTLGVERPTSNTWVKDGVWHRHLAPYEISDR